MKLEILEAEFELFISKWKCRFGKHILDFENDVQHHCYCGKKYVRKPVPKMPKVVKTRPAVKLIEPKTIKKFTKKSKFYPCPTQGKVSRTEHDAKEKAKSMGLRAYKCAWCPHWHLTSKKDKLSMH